MNNEEIINQLKLSLTGDQSDTDKIKLCMEKNYSNRELNVKLRELLIGYLTEEEKQIYTSIDKVHEYTEEKINKAIEAYEQKDFDIAIKHLNKVIEVGEVFKKVSINHSYSFGSLEQFILFSGRARVNNYDSVEWFGVRLSLAYQIMGAICIEKENFNNALMYFDKSIENNPIDTASHFEKLFVYEKLGNDKMFDITVKNVAKNIYTLEDFAKYYRVLGYHYAERDNAKFAYFLYLASLRYAKNENAYMEIEYLSQKLGGDVKLTPEEIKKYLTNYNIEVTIQPDIAMGLEQIVTDEKYSEIFSKEEMEQFTESAKIFLSFYGKNI